MAGKKKKRRAYLDDFKVNEEGKYDYTGTVYQYEADEDPENELRRELLKLWGLGMVLMSSLIGAGCISAPGMDNCIYVLLPYAAALIAGISVFWAFCRLTSGRNPLKEYVYEASVGKLPGRTVMTIFCVVMDIVGEIVYICFHGIGEKLAGLFLFAVLNLLAAASAVLMRRRILGMNWKKTGNI